ncbi:MAG: AAA family ATPase [Dehalococcoidia bacterium]
MKADEFLEKARRPSPLVEGLILRGHTVILGGFWGSSKSWFAEALAVSVAAGVPFLDRQVTQGPVMIIDEDSPQDILAERITRLGKGIGKEAGELPITIHCQGGFKLSSTRAVDMVQKEIESNAISLVVVDSLSSILGTLSENDMTEARQRWSKLKGEKGTATLFMIHHFGKVGEDLKEVGFTKALRGSTKLADSADTAFSIQGKAWPRIIKVEKQRHSLATEEFAIELEEDDQKTWARLKQVPLLRNWIGCKN